LLLFSLISGKQGKYLLPLLPLLALLTARALAGLQGTRFSLRFAGVLLAILGVVLTALPWWPWGPDRLSDVQALWGPALLLWSIPFFRWRLQRLAAVRATSLAVWLGTATLYLGVVNLMAPQVELRPLAVRLADLQQAGNDIAWLGKYHGQFQFLGRLQQRIEPLTDLGSVRDWLELHPRGYLLVHYATPTPGVPPSLPIQLYRSGSLVLWPAGELLRDPRQLDALAGNA
jgi:hypothetical protein